MQAKGTDHHPAPFAIQQATDGTGRVAGGSIPALDGFRAIAISMVLLSHVGLNRLVPGQFGVTLFFFLSGYLIATLLRGEIERTGGLSFAGFYLRRTVRIIPPMYLTIAFVVVLSLIGLFHPLNLGSLGWDLLFLSNYRSSSGVPIGLWSLAVEEHFYLSFPLFLTLAVKRLSFAAIARLCLVMCAAALAFRIWEVARLADFSQVNFWSHTRFDSILFGVILALWNNPYSSDRNRLPGTNISYLLSAGLLLISFAIRDEAFRQTFRYTIQGIALLLLFNAAIRDTRLARPLLDSMPLRFLAVHSYTLYLVHGIFVRACEPLVPWSGRPAAMAAAIALSIGYAMAIHRLVEKPLGRWRRRMESSRRTSVQSPGAASGWG